MNLFRSKFFQAVLVLVLTFLLFRFGIRPPAPQSVLSLYMTVVLIAVLVYVSSNSDSWRQFLAPLRALLVEEGKRPLRVALMVLLPLLFGYYAYTQAAATVEAPAELRAIHPAPPASITFKGKTLDIQGLENPLRKDAANLKKYVAEGAEIYIKNCIYCHGDNLDGNGHFAHVFNPPPANFTDPGTIAMLQEGFLFWRIAKGGPGLPKESTPWNSVMPAWEDRLSEEEIWIISLRVKDGGFIALNNGSQGPASGSAGRSNPPCPPACPRSAGWRAGRGRRAGSADLRGRCGSRTGSAPGRRNRPAVRRRGCGRPSPRRAVRGRSRRRARPRRATARSRSRPARDRKST